jgi:hypothetical protein
LIETNFRQQMVTAMKTIDPAFTDWMVAVTYRAVTSPRSGTTPANPPNVPK